MLIFIIYLYRINLICKIYFMVIYMFYTSWYSIIGIKITGLYSEKKTHDTHNNDYNFRIVVLSES